MDESDCRACAGTGWIYADDGDGGITEPSKIPCPLCGASFDESFESMREHAATDRIQRVADER